jgi:hypothetical protein
MQVYAAVKRNFSNGWQFANQSGRWRVQFVRGEETRIFHIHFNEDMQSVWSAGFPAGCVADFQVGIVSDAA